MHHFITKYHDENGNHVVVAWFQISIMGKCFCLFKRELII